VKAKISRLVLGPKPFSHKAKTSLPREKILLVPPKFEKRKKLAKPQSFGSAGSKTFPKGLGTTPFSGILKSGQFFQIQGPGYIIGQRRLKHGGPCFYIDVFLGHHQEIGKQNISVLKAMEQTKLISNCLSVI